MTNYYLSGGEQTSGLVLVDGDNLYVESGGTAIATMENASFYYGINIYVVSGGTVIDTTAYGKRPH